MEIVLLTVGKTTTPYILTGLDEYIRRLRHYVGYSIETIPDIRSTRTLTHRIQKELEGKQIIDRLMASDFVVLLDERGREMKSTEFSVYLQKQMLSGRKRLVFVVGGPYGFSEDVYDRSDSMISLSRMTFSHEMVRLFFTEQVYRAMTILRGEPYHHE